MATRDLRPENIRVRPALAADLPAADGVIRLAFGTAAGAPDPEGFFGDTQTVQNRWKTRDAEVLVAEMDGAIVAAVSVTRWGSFGFFGPFGVRPDLWNRGIAKTVVASVMDCFSRWRVPLAGLYTLPDSPGHIGLYQHFGFRPRFLTAVMAKSVGPTSPPEPPGVITYAGLPPDEKVRCLSDCRRLTDTVFEGLDLTSEIEAIDAQRLGDTLMIQKGSEIAGFAACHLGPGTEAGSGTCYVKFAAVHSDHAPRAFETLLSACAAYARRRGAQKLVAGVNTARRETYESMLGQGFQTQMLGVAMLRPDISGYNRPGVFVVDDWR